MCHDLEFDTKKYTNTFLMDHISHKPLTNQIPLVKTSGISEICPNAQRQHGLSVTSVLQMPCDYD